MCWYRRTMRRSSRRFCRTRMRRSPIPRCPSVRRILSERLAERLDAPRDLVVTLANDEIEVAHPILVKSEVLQDPELIEIVQHRTMEHQVAVAMRPNISEQVSNVLVQTNNEEVITALLSNQDAPISNTTMNHLVEQSAQVPGYQEPLVNRHDLPRALLKKLYWGVSAALRKHVLANFDLEPSDAPAPASETAPVDTIFAEELSVRAIAERWSRESCHATSEVEAELLAAFQKKLKGCSMDACLDATISRDDLITFCDEANIAPPRFWARVA